MCFQPGAGFGVGRAGRAAVGAARSLLSPGVMEQSVKPQQTPCHSLGLHLLVIITPQQLPRPEPWRIRLTDWEKKGNCEISCRENKACSADVTVVLTVLIIQLGCAWHVQEVSHFLLELKGFQISLTMGINRIVTYLMLMTETPSRSSCWPGKEGQWALNPQGHLGSSLSTSS